MKYLLLVLFVVLVGCADTSNNPSRDNFGLQLLTIDGCEYALYVDVTGGGTAMVHHGNCHNPVHGVKSWGTVIDVDSVTYSGFPERKVIIGTGRYPDGVGEETPPVKAGSFTMEPEQKNKP